MDLTVGIIGLGNMGEAILKALLRSGFPKKSVLCAETKEERARERASAYGVKIVDEVAELVRKSRYVIIAVKPQDAKELAGTMALSLDDRTTLISIMAGITTAGLLSMVGKPARIVRLMPNIAARVGEAAIGMCANFVLQKKETEEVLRILQPLGKVVEVSEELMDGVTALSGSGPAFFLTFLEAMIDGGVKMGLTREKASVLAIQTIKGTVTLLEEEKIHPSLLREMVTSPGGTTIAGLALLEDKGFKGAVIRAIEAAMLRARELSK
jgi:pyrroline-5-carboxylate reductase